MSTRLRTASTAPERRAIRHHVVLIGCDESSRREWARHLQDDPRVALRLYDPSPHNANTVAEAVGADAGQVYPNLADALKGCDGAVVASACDEPRQAILDAIAAGIRHLAAPLAESTTVAVEIETAAAAAGAQVSHPCPLALMAGEILDFAAANLGGIEDFAVEWRRSNSTDLWAEVGPDIIALGLELARRLPGARTFPARSVSNRMVGRASVVEVEYEFKFHAGVETTPPMIGEEEIAGTITGVDGTLRFWLAPDREVVPVLNTNRGSIQLDNLATAPLNTIVVDQASRWIGSIDGLSPLPVRNQDGVSIRSQLEACELSAKSGGTRVIPVHRFSPRPAEPRILMAFKIPHARRQLETVFERRGGNAELVDVQLLGDEILRDHRSVQFFDVVGSCRNGVSPLYDTVAQRPVTLDELLQGGPRGPLAFKGGSTVTVELGVPRAIREE